MLQELPPMKPGSGTFVASTILGAVSAASGAAMLKSPRPMARLYGLPNSTELARWLGARDLVVGTLLLSPRFARYGAVARALSDVLDATLISRHAERLGRRAWGRVAVALGSALAGTALSVRLRTPDSRRYA
jgi:hypothetical protein